MTTKKTEPANIHEAMVLIQKEIKNPAKNKTASGAGQYSYKYADLAEILTLARPICAEHGVYISQPIHAADGYLWVTSILRHAASDTNIQSEWPICAVSGLKPQVMGTNTTYARRYSLSPLLGIAADDDIDGDMRDDPPVAPVKKIDAAQEFELVELMDTVGQDKPRFCNYFQIEKISDLPAAEFDNAMQLLSKKAKQNG